MILKKKKNLYWVADFRDSWMEFHARPKYNFIRNLIESKMEKSVMKNADFIVTASPGIADKLKKKYNGYYNKIKCVPNGFDGNDFIKYKDFKKEKNSKISFLHSGTLWNVRNPEIMMSVLEKIVMEYDNVIFNFIGFNFMDNSLIEYITKKHERIKISNYIPHDEVLKELLKSDVLMLMQSRVSIESYPGKMFEYIAAKKLVFLIGPENGNACDLLKEYKKFVRAEPENTDDIYLKIRYIIDNFDELDKIKPKRDFIDSYDRRYLTRKLVSIIEKTTI